MKITFKLWRVEKLRIGVKGLVDQHSFLPLFKFMKTHLKVSYKNAKDFLKYIKTMMWNLKLKMFPMLNL